MDIFLLDSKYQLAWAEYGAPDGEPVFYFHGIPGSQLEAKLADNITRELGIRLIAPDRPGYGDSDQQDNFKPLDWPGIIAQLADKLNIHRFSILGFSGGGIFALACAHEIADRIKHITLISSPASFETNVMQNGVNADTKPLYELAAADYNAAVEQISLLATSAENLLDALLVPLPPEDKDLFNQKNFRQHYLDNIALAIKSGVHGIANDLRCFALPWQFNLSDINTNIDIWHGRCDRSIGFAVAEHLANTFNNTFTHFLDNKGHLYLFAQWQEVLEQTKLQGLLQHEASI